MKKIGQIDISGQKAPHPVGAAWRRAPASIHEPRDLCENWLQSRRRGIKPRPAFSTFARVERFAGYASRFAIPGAGR